jgi:hypothetical protein
LLAQELPKTLPCAEDERRKVIRGCQKREYPLPDHQNLCWSYFFGRKIKLIALTSGPDRPRLFQLWRACASGALELRADAKIRESFRIKHLSL